ncbi:MAG: hypothetical protein ACOYMS_11575, partial [Terrimicrobiaceae bacterium]
GWLCLPPMKLPGRLACLVAILGLFCQFVEASAVLSHDQVVAAECRGDAHDSHCPMEPLHDHCGSFCGHFFTAVPDSSEGFYVSRPDTASFQTVSQESAPEGFPAGLFIPPRLS